MNLIEKIGQLAVNYIPINPVKEGNITHKGGGGDEGDGGDGGDRGNCVRAGFTTIF
jgi:hypothetical protein